MTASVNRADLQQLKGITPKLVRFFESLFSDTAANTQDVAGVVAGTGAIQNATVLTLSSNTAFNNERIVAFDPAAFVVVDGGPGDTLAIGLLNLIVLNGAAACTFNLQADTNLDLPTSGIIPSSAIGPFADDTAAAAGGVQLGAIYKVTGGTMAWRQV